MCHSLNVQNMTGYDRSYTADVHKQPANNTVYHFLEYCMLIANINMEEKPVPIISGTDAAGPGTGALSGTAIVPIPLAALLFYTLL